MQERPALGRIAATAGAVVTASLLLWLAVSFGPVPEAPILRPGVALPVSPPWAKRRSGMIQAVQPEVVMAIFGARRVVDSSGCAASPPDRYAAGIEDAYRKAGYRPAQELQLSQGRGSATQGLVLKTYWMSRNADAFSIGAFTTGGPGSATRPSSLEMTSMVAEPACGTRWEKYHYAMPRDKVSTPLIAGGLGTDDSGDLPLPSGTQHLFSVPAESGGEMKFYSIAMASETLRQWFRANMSRRWLDMDPPGGRGSSRNSGLLYFAQADRYCMIFVADKQRDAKSMVVVSMGRI